MAINTSGYRVSVMPQFAPSNPHLVAFNPMAIGDGMGQAFSLAQMYEHLKSSKALQAELEATRENRLRAQNAMNSMEAYKAASQQSLIPDMEGAQRAGYQAQTMTAIPDAKFKLLSMDEKSRAMPTLTDESIASGQFNTQMAQGRMGNIPSLVSAEAAGAKAKTAEANYAGKSATAREGNIPDVAEAEGATARAKTAGANIEVNTADVKQEALKAQLALGKIVSELTAANAPAKAQSEALDIAMHLSNARDTNDLAMSVKRAQALKDTAMAHYYENGGSSKKYDPETEARELQNLIAKANTLKTADGRLLPQYIKDTYEPASYNDANGQKVQQERNFPWVFVAKDDKVRDPLGDMYMQQRISYEKQLESLQSQLGGKLRVQGAKPAANQSAQGQTSKLPKPGQVVDGFQYLGGDPKARSSWQKAQ